MCTVRGQPKEISETFVKILEVLDSVPPKGPQNDYDPNYFDTSYDYGGFGGTGRGGYGGNTGRGRGGPPRGGGGGRFPVCSIYLTAIFTSSTPPSDIRATLNYSRSKQKMF